MLPRTSKDSFAAHCLMNPGSSTQLISSSLQAEPEVMKVDQQYSVLSAEVSEVNNQVVENQESNLEEILDDVETVSVTSYDSKAYNLQIQDVQIACLNQEHNKRKLNRKIAQRNRKVVNEVNSLPPETHLMLILCGIPGSGKSTFANRVVEAAERFYYCGYESDQNRETLSPKNDPVTTENLVLVKQTILNTNDKPSVASTLVTCSETQLESSAAMLTCEILRSPQPVSAVIERPLQLHFLRGWQHYTQDAFKSRKSMESYCVDALWKGHNLIVDRCNFDAAQRKHWIDMLYSVYQPYLQHLWECQALTDSPTNNLNHIKPFHILCVLVPNYNNTQLCIKRAVQRGDSDGLHEAGTDWNLVCNAMNSQFQYPMKCEGIDNIYHCRNDTDLELLFNCL
jgi:DNA polymerase III delta prime subunit